MSDTSYCISTLLTMWVYSIYLTAGHVMLNVITLYSTSGAGRDMLSAGFCVSWMCCTT